jgi:hypothetical protein
MFPSSPLRWSICFIEKKPDSAMKQVAGTSHLTEVPAAFHALSARGQRRTNIFVNIRLVISTEAGTNPDSGFLAEANIIILCGVAL